LFLILDTQYANDPSGCTAVTAIITPQNHVYVGNAGDSRAVISVGGVANPMSNDHKPVNKEESERITKAGGFVEFGRVNGMILFIVLKIVFYLWFYSD
jgi:serine/threonine protein phosphatase PrpC